MSVLESYLGLGIYFGFFSAFGCLVTMSITHRMLNEQLGEGKLNVVGVIGLPVITWVSGGLLSMITAYIHYVIQ